MLELKKAIEYYINNGESLDEIKTFCDLIIDKHLKTKKPKRKKKKTVICRPVLFISDSSSDEN